MSTGGMIFCGMAFNRMESKNAIAYVMFWWVLRFLKCSALYVECHSVIGNHSAECHFAEWHSVEFHYGKFHPAECDSFKYHFQNVILWNVIPLIYFYPPKNTNWNANSQNASPQNASNRLTLGRMKLSRLKLSRMKFSRMTFSRMPVNRLTLGRMKLSRMKQRRLKFSGITFSRMTFSRMTFSRMVFDDWLTLQTECNHFADCHSVKWHFADCHSVKCQSTKLFFLGLIIPSVFLVNVILLNNFNYIICHSSIKYHYAESFSDVSFH